MTLVLAMSACSPGNDATDQPPSPQQTASASASVTPPASTTPAEPSTPPLPTAKDGQNYKACTDGNCEVLIEKTATLTIDGKKVTATVEDGYVQLVQRGPDGFQVGVSGSGGTSWGDSNGPRHSLSLKAADGTTAVVVLTTTR